MARSELGRALRTARRAAGITQTRLAERLGVPANRLVRWELGEAVPTRAELRGLARHLGVGTAEAARWSAWVGDGPGVPGTPAPAVDGGTIAVEIVPARAVSADPWGVTAASALLERPRDEDATARRHAAAVRRRARVAERRTARREARERHRRSVAVERAAERKSDGTRRAESRTAAGVPEPPVFAPDLIEDRSHIKATVNRGAVFPIPAPRSVVDKYTYSTAAPTFRSTPEERLVYLTRWIRVALALVALVAVLAWAWNELGHGWDAVIDLFRGDDEPIPVVDALRLWFGV